MCEVLLMIEAGLHVDMAAGLQWSFYGLHEPLQSQLTTLVPHGFYVPGSAEHHAQNLRR